MLPKKVAAKTQNVCVNESANSYKKEAYYQSNRLRKNIQNSLIRDLKFLKHRSFRELHLRFC